MLSSLIRNSSTMVRPILLSSGIRYFLICRNTWSICSVHSASRPSLCLILERRQENGTARAPIPASVQPTGPARATQRGTVVMAAGAATVAVPTEAGTSTSSPSAVSQAVSTDGADTVMVAAKAAALAAAIPAAVALAALASPNPVAVRAKPLIVPVSSSYSSSFEERCPHPPESPRPGTLLAVSRTPLVLLPQMFG